MECHAKSIYLFRHIATSNYYTGKTFVHCPSSFLRLQNPLCELSPRDKVYSMPLRARVVVCALTVSVGLLSPTTPSEMLDAASVQPSEVLTRSRLVQVAE